MNGERRGAPGRGELGHEVGRADNVGVPENGPDVPQEFHANRAILLLVRKQASSPPAPPWPSPASSAIARAGAIVGRAVVQVGHLRIEIGQLAHQRRRSVQGPIAAPVLAARHSTARDRAPVTHGCQAKTRRSGYDLRTSAFS